MCMDPLTFPLKRSSFFPVALKAAPISLPCLLGMRQQSASGVVVDTLERKIIIKQTHLGKSTACLYGCV